jgi:hypothetical protein
MSKLLSRDDFREGVFARDGHKCVVCGTTALDAHHILERRLWGESGGYFLDNGVSVCETHHLACERTDISVEEIREYAGIVKKVIPDHLYNDQVYDKWGNPILPNGMRLIGELFFDESVQKILRDKLELFTHYVKYPRTTHVPWSPGMNEDDRILSSMDHFIGKEVVVPEKMDGENNTMYSDYYHARSLDGRNHPSRNWVKNFWSSISHDIPDRWRVCGENMYAKHSIGYENLESYFYGFSIWNDKNICLSWDDTLEWFQMLGITPVPVLYRGIYDEKAIKAIDLPWDTCEGYVIRLANEFSFAEFKKSVAKCVRRGHVQTTKHWMHGQRMEVNGLKA